MMKKRVILLLALMAAMTTKAQTVGEITDSVKAGLKAGSVKDAVNTVKGAFTDGRHMDFRRACCHGDQWQITGQGCR